MKFVLIFLAGIGVALAAPKVHLTELSTRGTLPEFKFEIDNEAIKERISKRLKERLNRVDIGMNEVFDEILIELRALLIDSGLDPLAVPDILLGFEYNLLLITFHGELELTNGWLQDISTMYRAGDSVLSLDQVSRLVVPIGFNNLIGSYAYSAKLMDLGPTGSVIARVDDIVAHFDILVDLSTFTIHNIVFEFDAGSIDVNFYGNITDFLLNLVLDLVTGVLHDQVVWIINVVIDALIPSLIPLIGDILADFLS